jgi:hypothetical protein
MNGQFSFNIRLLILVTLRAEPKYF